MNLKQSIEIYQKEKNLRDCDLSRIWEVSPAIVCKIKSGKRHPGPKTFQAVRQKTPELIGAFLVDHIKRVVYGEE